MSFLSLVIQMGLNAAGVEVGLKKAESAIDKFSKKANSSIKGQIAAALSVGALAAAAKNAVEYASHINDLSTQLGISTEKLQEYGYAATQTGGNLDEFAAAARKLSQARQEALNDPKGKEANAFKQLGVSADDLKTKGIPGLIDQVGAAFEQAKNPQALLASGFAVLGRTSLPVIGAMREGLAQFGADAREAGLIIKDETIQHIDDMGDSVDRLKTSFISASAEGLSVFAKGLMEVWRATKSTVAGVAAYYGALSGGASDKDAKKMGYEARVKEIQNDVSSDQAFQNAKAKRKETVRMINEGTYEATDPKKEKGVSGYYKSNANSLQQIGAYSGVDPIVSQIKESNVSLKKIEDNTKRSAQPLGVDPVQLF